jgi:hypothetical protein
MHTGETSSDGGSESQMLPDFFSNVGDTGMVERGAALLSPLFASTVSERILETSITIYGHDYHIWTCKPRFCSLPEVMLFINVYGEGYKNAFLHQGEEVISTPFHAIFNPSQTPFKRHFNAILTPFDATRTPFNTR